MLSVSNLHYKGLVTAMFDETLFSDYLRDELTIQSGVYDPVIFKLIYMLGGPGSGKSYAMKQLGLKSMGFRIVASDIYLEHMLVKAGVSLDLRKMDEEKRDNLRRIAKNMDTSARERWIAGRLGLVIESTSFVARKKEQLGRLKAIGYDVGLVYLDTPLEVALKRNKERPRKVPENIVRDRNKQVLVDFTEMKKSIKNKANIWMIAANESGTDDPDLEKDAIRKHKLTMRRAVKGIRHFANDKPKHPAAKQWIEDELASKKR